MLTPADGSCVTPVIIQDAAIHTIFFLAPRLTIQQTWFPKIVLLINKGKSMATQG